MDGTITSPFQLLLGGALSILMYAVVGFAVWKIFAIAGDVAEIKETLKEIKRNTEDKSPDAFAARYPPSQSAANLVRAVNTASYSEVENADATK